MHEILDLRPTEIVLAYWKENVMIEEDADLLDPIYLEVS